MEDEQRSFWPTILRWSACICLFLLLAYVLSIGPVEGSLQTPEGLPLVYVEPLTAFVCSIYSGWLITMFFWVICLENTSRPLRLTLTIRESNMESILISQYRTHPLLRPAEAEMPGRRRGPERSRTCLST